MLRKRYSIEKTDDFNLINSTELVKARKSSGAKQNPSPLGKIVVSSYLAALPWHILFSENIFKVSNDNNYAYNRVQIGV